MRGVEKLVPDTKRSSEPWGSASAREGANNHEQASEFIEKYPIGTELTTQKVEQIGTELFPRSLLPDGSERPPLSASQVATRLNAAGNHPRMGEHTFHLHSPPGSGGVWLVRSLYEEIDDSETIVDAFKATVNSINKLKRKLRGANLKALPDQTRQQIYASYRDAMALSNTLARMVEDESLSLADAAAAVQPSLAGRANGQLQDK